MLHMTLVLEDIILSANASPAKCLIWHVRSINTFSGETAEAEWTGPQLAAVTALALGVDIEYLHVIANEACKDWPVDCCPMA